MTLSQSKYSVSLILPRLDIPGSSTTELSELGRDFFTRLFERCDQVNVSLIEMIRENLLSTDPP